MTVREAGLSVKEGSQARAWPGVGAGGEPLSSPLSLSLSGVRLLVAGARLVRPLLPCMGAGSIQAVRQLLSYHQQESIRAQM